MNRSWGMPFTVAGLPPVGEIETRCAGCRCRFESGQPAMQRFEDTLPLALWAHIECTDRVEELERAGR